MTVIARITSAGYGTRTVTCVDEPAFWEFADRIDADEVPKIPEAIRSTRRTWLQVALYPSVEVAARDTFDLHSPAFPVAVYWRGDFGVLRENREACYLRRCREAGIPETLARERLEEVLK